MKHEKLYIIRKQNDEAHIDKQTHFYGYSVNYLLGK